MTTSKTNGHLLCPLSFTTLSNYETNLQTLLSLVNEAPKGSFVLAPEVCLSGFDYEHWDAVLFFAPHAIEKLLEASKEKTVMLTLVEKRGEDVWNIFKVFHKGSLVYERPKAKLFRFGGEERYFSEASSEDVAIFEIEGIRCGVLICFELRFKELWQRLEGCDVIFVPAWWGALRTEHFSTLTRALAIMNQCYVVLSDAQNEECTRISGVIKPNGEAFYNGKNPSLVVQYEKKEIALMRRYMDVGIG